MNSASPFFGSNLSTGIRFAEAMTFWPRQVGFLPTSDPRASHVMYADSASTSFDVVVGSVSRSSSGVPALPVSSTPVAFSLRTKQSTIRSPSVYKRPERRLYSGNIPATPTSGRDLSRCPPFRWQLLQDTLLGVNLGASPGVLVKIRNPQRISFDSVESSRLESFSGFFGNSHAVTIVVRAGISGPASGTPDAVLGCGVREHEGAHNRSVVSDPHAA